MTYKQLKEIIEAYSIPDDVTMMSDSGWECDATHMNGVYYNVKENCMVFVQSPHSSDTYYKDPNWEKVYGEFPTWDPIYNGGGC